MYKCTNCNEISKPYEPSFLIYEYKIDSKRYKQIKSQKRVCKICYRYLKGKELNKIFKKTTGLSILSQSQILRKYTKRGL